MAAEGIAAEWNGTADAVHLLETRTEPDRLRALPGDARAIVAAHAAEGLFSVSKTGDTSATLNCGSATLVTLARPDPDAYLRTFQLQHMRTAMELRGDRMPEILVQQGEMLSFFGCITRMDSSRHWWTSLLLSTLYNTIVGPEQTLKLYLDTPRPMELAPQIVPMIQTPGHSSYPSGHATEAFAFATLLSALLIEGRGTDGPAAVASLDDLENLPDAVKFYYRLAHRIADNRTVAGVHYPADSAHGAILGHAMAHAFAVTCKAGAGTVAPWTTGFTDGESDAIGAFPATAVAATLTPGAAPSVALPDLPGKALLNVIWTEAVKEWQCVQT